MSAKCEECSMDLFQKNTGEYFCVYCSNSQEIADLHNQLSEKEAECERLYERIKRLEEKVMFYRKHSYINKVILKKPEGEVKG